MVGLAERDHKQMLEPLAYHLVWEIGPVMDQRGNDLSRIGQEAQDVTDRPEDLRIVIIIKYPAMPSIGIGKSVGAIEVVQHGEVRQLLPDVHVRRPP